MRHAFRCEYNQQNREGDARLHQKRRPSRSQRAKESKNLVASIGGLWKRNGGMRPHHMAHGAHDAITRAAGLNAHEGQEIELNSK
jgi:hypothetical protein